MKGFLLVIPPTSASLQEYLRLSDSLHPLCFPWWQKPSSPLNTAVLWSICKPKAREECSGKETCWIASSSLNILSLAKFVANRIVLIQQNAHQILLMLKASTVGKPPWGEHEKMENGIPAKSKRIKVIPRRQHSLMISFGNNIRKWTLSILRRHLIIFYGFLVLEQHWCSLFKTISASLFSVAIPISTHKKKSGKGMLGPFLLLSLSVIVQFGYVIPNKQEPFRVTSPAILVGTWERDEQTQQLPLGRWMMSPIMASQGILQQLLYCSKNRKGDLRKLVGKRCWETQICSDFCFRGGNQLKLFCSSSSCTPYMHTLYVFYFTCPGGGQGKRNVLTDIQSLRLLHEKSETKSGKKKNNNKKQNWQSRRTAPCEHAPTHQNTAGWSYF